jgi:hypothetical protein
MSVRGPQVGGREASTVAWKTADLTNFGGQYVDIMAETEDIFVCFCAAAADVPTIAALATDDFTTDNVARFVPGATGIQRVVPKARPFLRYIRASADGVISIHPA